MSELCALVHDIDPRRLVTYANYPTAEYLHGDDSDFVTFNVFLETRQAFHRYLTKLQHAAGARPLVLGEVGLDSAGDADGERRQAEVLEWQLEVAMERGVAGCCVFSWTDAWTVAGRPVDDWHFGVAHRDVLGVDARTVLLVSPPAGVLITSRTYTTGSIGTFGQFIPPTTVAIHRGEAPAIGG